MRGTDDLALDRRPRSRKRTRRAQPYRRHHRGRQRGPTLTAMLKGAPAFLPNPMDAKRAFIKRHGR
jgi:hypothetical protein